MHVTAPKAKVAKAVPKPAEASDDEEDGDESDLAITDSDDDAKIASLPLSERDAAKRKKKAEKKKRRASRKRRETIVEKSLTAEVEKLAQQLEQKKERAGKEL